MTALRRVRFRLVSALFGLVACQCFAGDLPTPAAGTLATMDTTFDVVATRILRLSDLGDYEAALMLCDSLRLAQPEHPGPYLSTAGVYVNWMQSFRLNDYQAEVDSNAQRAIDAGTRMLKSSQDPWLSFYVGSAYGYRALSRLRRHNWIGAFLDGRRANEHLNRALKRDAELYDAYFALGAYHYWRTARSGFLRAVAFWMPDRRQLGLRQMRLAIDHGRYIRTGALHGLSLALYDSGDLEAALAVNDEILAVIDPPTNGALYLRGRLLAQQGDWTGVERTFTTLLERLPVRSVGYAVECQYWIARSLAARGQRAAARQLCRQALAHSVQRQPQRELHSALESFDTILDWLRTLNSQLAPLDS